MKLDPVTPLKMQKTPDKLGFYATRIYDSISLKYPLADDTLKVEAAKKMSFTGKINLGLFVGFLISSALIAFKGSKETRELEAGLQVISFLTTFAISLFSSLRMRKHILALKESQKRKFKWVKRFI